MARLTLLCKLAVLVAGAAAMQAAGPWHGGIDSTSLLQFPEEDIPIKDKTKEYIKNAIEEKTKKHMEDAANNAVKEGEAGETQEGPSGFFSSVFKSLTERFDSLVAGTKDRIDSALEGTKLGINRIPGDYIKDLMSLTRAGYAEVFCNGKVGGCRIKEEFVGSKSTLVMGWEAVKEMVSKTPEKEWSGEWWRGCELGLLIVNPFFWHKNHISPPSIGLGITPKQHAVVRPLIEKLYTLEKMPLEKQRSIEELVRKMTKEFLEGRMKKGKLHVPKDLTAFVHQVLYQVAFDEPVDWKDAKEFVSLQSKVVTYGLVSQILDQWSHKLFMTGVAERVGGYVQKLHGKLEKMMLDKKLTDISTLDDCKPSESCTWQLASAVWDTLYAAGGLSTPTNLATGLGLIFSDKNNPFPGARNVNFSDPYNARVFMWENHRVFAPVVGFPHWTQRPTCDGGTAREATDALNKAGGGTEACPMRGDDASTYRGTNQYEGGHREIPVLAMAQLDPEKWGPDAGEFKMRSESTYKELNQGFADFAVDPNVAGGKMNRICPGKSLDLKIGEIFFQEFSRYIGEYETPKVEFVLGPTWVSSFTLKKKGSSSSFFDFFR